MTTDIKALRAAFEAWYTDGYPRAAERSIDGDYRYIGASLSWAAYQAGHAGGVADERERCAQLCDKLSRRAGDAMDCRDAIRAGAKEPSDG